MFEAKIRETEYTQSSVASAFENIKTHGSEIDMSFISTLRALLGERLRKTDTTLSLEAYQNSIDDGFVELRLNGELEETDYSEEDFFGKIKYTDTTYVIQLQDVFAIRDFHSFNKLMDLNPYGSKQFRLTSVETFIKQKLDVVCWVIANTEMDTTIIYTTSWTPKFYHTIQSFLPLFVPKLFKDCPLKENEKTLLKTLAERNRGNYLEALSALYESSRIMDVLLEQALKGFTAHGTTNLVNRMENRVSWLEDKIAELCNELEHVRNDHREAQATLFGAKYMADQNNEKADKELIDYFCTQQSAHFVEVNNGFLNFYVTCDIDNFSSADYENLVSTHRNWYDTYVMPSSACMTKPQLNELMKAIFEDERFKIQTCAGFNMSADRPDSTPAISGYRFPQNVTKDRMPNPHLDIYSCVGPAQERFSYYLSKNDWIGAIETAVNVSKGLTFSDSTVMSRFINTLVTSKKAYLRDTIHGDIVNAEEAIKRIEGETE